MKNDSIPLNTSNNTFPWLHVVTNPLDNGLRANAWGKNFFYPGLFEGKNVVLWYDSSTKDGHIFSATFFERLHHRRKERHVGTRQDTESNRINIFLDCRLGNHVRCLVQPGVDDFKSSI